MDAPLWFKIIQLRYRGRIAPTVTFLAGALFSDIGSNCLYELLTSMLDDVPSNFVSRIYRCPEIGQPVANTMYSIYDNGHGLESEKQSRRTILLGEDFDQCTTFEHLLECIRAELDPIISSGRFSFRHGQYMAFNSEDEEIIRIAKET